MQTINIGDKFRGAVTGTVFEVISQRTEQVHTGLAIEYVLSHGKGDTVRASWHLLQWLLKSGELARV